MRPEVRLAVRELTVRHGAAEAVQFVRSLLWDLPEQSFDAAFSNQS